MFNDLAVLQRLQGDVGAQALSQHAFTQGVRQVVSVPPAGVVRMAMGDDGALHRPPGVDVKVARRAVQAFGPGNDEVRMRNRHARQVCRKGLDLVARSPKQRGQVRLLVLHLALGQHRRGWRRRAG